MGTGAFVLILVFGLLVVVGVVASVRLYSEGAVGTGRFRNVRRIRTIKSSPAGKIIEDTIEEVSDEEEPIEEAGP